MSSVNWLRVVVRRVVCAFSWVRRVCASVERSASGTDVAVDDDDDGLLLVDRREAAPEGEEPWSTGRVALRYSAGSKTGLRNACRNGSAVWADLESILTGVPRPLLAVPPGMPAPLGPVRL